MHRSGAFKESVSLCKCVEIRKGLSLTYSWYDPKSSTQPHSSTQSSAARGDGQMTTAEAWHQKASSQTKRLNNEHIL